MRPTGKPIPGSEDLPEPLRSLLAEAAPLLADVGDAIITRLQQAAAEGPDAVRRAQSMIAIALLVHAEGFVDTVRQFDHQSSLDLGVGLDAFKRALARFVAGEAKRGVL